MTDDQVFVVLNAKPDECWCCGGELPADMRVPFSSLTIPLRCPTVFPQIFICNKCEEKLASNRKRSLPNSACESRSIRLAYKAFLRGKKYPEIRVTHVSASGTTVNGPLASRRFFGGG